MIFNSERFKDPPNEVDLTDEKWLYGEYKRLIERKKSKEMGKFKPYWENEEPPEKNCVTTRPFKGSLYRWDQKGLVDGITYIFGVKKN